MEPSRETKGDPRPSRRGAQRDLVGAIVVWGRVLVGLALATVGGVAFGHAWTHESAPLWWVGAITLLVGILLVLSGWYARAHPRGITPEVALREETAEGREPLVPLLGAVLLYKYQRITQQQLNEALGKQRKEKHKRRVGEILLAMKAVTRSQLQEALEYQQSFLRDKEATQEG